MGRSYDLDDDYLAVQRYCNKLRKKKTVVTSRKQHRPQAHKISNREEKLNLVFLGATSRIMERLSLAE
jgi:hypothetical protein